MSDDSFHIPVEPAATALNTAKYVLAWMSQEEPVCSQWFFMSEVRAWLGDGPQDMRSLRFK